MRWVDPFHCKILRRTTRQKHKRSNTEGTECPGPGTEIEKPAGQGRLFLFPSKFRIPEWKNKTAGIGGVGVTNECPPQRKELRRAVTNVRIDSFLGKGNVTRFSPFVIGTPGSFRLSAADESAGQEGFGGKEGASRRIFHSCPLLPALALAMT